MERVVDVAQYLYERYKMISGDNVDEMKLYKLLYFCQRESLAITGKPMFSEPMLAWKFGPVSEDVRMVYSQLYGMQVDDIKPIQPEAAYIANNIVAQYGGYASWKLSEMSHMEYSWRNARKGIPIDKCGHVEIAISDIIKDAEKIRPYDSVYDMYYDEFDDAEVI